MRQRFFIMQFPGGRTLSHCADFGIRALGLGVPKADGFCSGYKSRSSLSTESLRCIAITLTITFTITITHIDSTLMIICMDTSQNSAAQSIRPPGF